jgi:hypothetical protein
VHRVLDSPLDTPWRTCNHFGAKRSLPDQGRTSSVAQSQIPTGMYADTSPPRARKSAYMIQSFFSSVFQITWTASLAFSGEEVGRD